MRGLWNILCKCIIMNAMFTFFIVNMFWHFIMVKVYVNF